MVRTFAVVAAGRVASPRRPVLRWGGCWGGACASQGVASNAPPGPLGRTQPMRAYRSAPLVPRTSHRAAGSCERWIVISRMDLRRRLTIVVVGRRENAAEFYGDQSDQNEQINSQHPKRDIYRGSKFDARHIRSFNRWLGRPALS